MAAPVFFDPSGKRGLWARRALAALIVAIIVAAIAFATTLVTVRGGSPLALPFVRYHPETLPAQHAGRHHGRPGWLPRIGARPPRADRPLAIGFYLPGDKASATSLARHGAALDWVVPASITLRHGDHAPVVTADRAFLPTLAALPHRPLVLPMVQNLGEDGWDGAGIAALLADRPARATLAAALGRQVSATRAAGLVMDLEELPAAAVRAYPGFLRQIKAALPAGSTLAVTVPTTEAGWDYRAFAAAADKVMLMAYDEHWEGGDAGPIASQPWFVDEVRRALPQIGRDKLIVALGSYAYDWHKGGADALGVEDAWLAAHDSAAPVRFDPVSGNAGFAYDEDDGEHHEVWMLDAATSWNQLRALKAMGLGAVALWRLGIEDPGFWTALAAAHDRRADARPDLSVLANKLSVDVEGRGEVLRITATPTPGRRSVGYDAQGLIRDERYDRLPTPYIVQRSGGHDGLVALTFDDGPDPQWTPQILSILERARVPATFFVIGENALSEPGLMRREEAGGFEIGNHTYTHPNLALTSADATRLELAATQRLIQAYTGRGTKLFRAPYFGDAEPTTADEIDPALVAQQEGYTVVGLHADPNDWQRPGVDAIVNQVVQQVTHPTAESSESIVLLHDGGGDRAQTVAALPRIIAALRARGYRFVSVSQLVGLPRDAVMPPVTGGDLIAVRTDVAVFVVLAAAAAALAWLFYLAIALGLARAVLMALLAWMQSRRPRPAPPVYQPGVSVIIPAYNEERVIEASVRRVLASDYPGLSVIVVDDGSKDRTSAIVREAFGDDPRVVLMTLVNGGKAAALNHALARADGEVVIALDADTQFEPETIARLARWFADPAIGAVAGDARVGNRVNLVTRWQAVEYITAQNLERRALAGFDAMTVVPGAVGAWRRAALDAVGGYPEDTLAEDQDLTIAIQRAGWKVTYDPRAVAWTEAPESFRALAKQRYRWAFGTLQCLWKHAPAIRRRQPPGLALVGMPQAWLFQIAFAAISPLIDLALVLSILTTALNVYNHGWAQTSSQTGTIAAFWVAFTGIDLLCGWVAYRLDARGVRFPPLLLVAQRFVYRQIMYWVVIRAISSAIGGWVVGWGKLERSGSVTTPGAA